MNKAVENMAKIITSLMFDEGKVANWDEAWTWAEALYNAGLRFIPELSLLKGIEIGDNLDLENEGEYPCSDGSITMTISVDKLLQAQLDLINRVIDEYNR